MPRRVVPICSLPSFVSPAWSRQHVVRHDQVRVGADPQAREVDALGAQLVQLARQHLRVDHDAVADRAQLARIQDPGRDQVELPLHAVADDGVAGVVAALEADHHVRLLGEQVDDLALALVAPLGAHDHDAGHVVGSVYGAPRARSARRPPPRSASSNGSGVGRAASARAARTRRPGAGRRRTSAAARRTSRTAATPCARRSARAARAAAARRRPRAAPPVLDQVRGQRPAPAGPRSGC